MLDYSALRAVTAVVQTGSFEKAAGVLNVTASAVSQRVKHLEERLGAVLIARGNPCTATTQGNGSAAIWRMSACSKVNCSSICRSS